MNEFFTEQPFWAAIIIMCLGEALSRMISFFWGLKPARSLKISNFSLLNKEIKFLGFISLFALLATLTTYYFFTTGIILKNTFYILNGVLFFIIFIQVTRILYSSKLLAESAVDLGVSGFDTEIKNGLSYDETLKQSTESIKFLGIGANKLIESSEFVSAIKRCNENSGSIAEFVICDPHSPALLKMEKRNNKPENTYSSRIKDSLREIKSLKEKDYKIIVKVYLAEEISDLPSFRVFISNSKVAYVSFYVIGSENEEGRRLPQLHFSYLKRSNDMPTFYRAFNQYYDQASNKAHVIEHFDEYI